MNETSRRRDDVEIALVARDVKYIISEMEKIEKKLDSDYVTQDQFEPVRKIVYGLVATVLLAVIAAILAIVIKP